MRITITDEMSLRLQEVATMYKLGLVKPSVVMNKMLDMTLGRDSATKETEVLAVPKTTQATSADNDSDIDGGTPKTATGVVM